MGQCRGACLVTPTKTKIKNGCLADNKNRSRRIERKNAQPKDDTAYALPRAVT